jgi:hypothetical protein
MRRLAYLVVAGLVSAGPAWASDMSGALDMIAPECSKPVAQLSLAEIEECRHLLRFWGGAGHRDAIASPPREQPRTVVIIRGMPR